MVNEKDDRTFGDRVADHVAEFGGSWRFIFVGIGLLILWMAFNLLHYYDFDPYPFILLNLVLSCVAAFQAPFIMMSQNRSEKKQEEAHRALLTEIKMLVEHDIKLEQEIKELIEHDIKIEKKILKLLGEKGKSDPENTKGQNI